MGATLLQLRSRPRLGRYSGRLMHLRERSWCSRRYACHLLFLSALVSCAVPYGRNSTLTVLSGGIEFQKPKQITQSRYPSKRWRSFVNFTL
ncbi:MAG: hypothetical protein ACD_23C01218G0004 [uncultured bacterium]|nr:MAG: hypothetical protein ACD_23C01218G0004 [uncultured bacterium]